MIRIVLTIQAERAASRIPTGCVSTGGLGRAVPALPDLLTDGLGSDEDLVAAVVERAELLERAGQ